MDPTIEEVSKNRVYCVRLAQQNDAPIRIRADCMRREAGATGPGHTLTFTRAGQTVGEVTSEVAAWWIEEADIPTT